MSLTYPDISPIKLRKVISGGQTGSEQGALFAAKHCLILTAGYASPGWRTTRGSQPELTKYGLKEYDPGNFKLKEYPNIRLSDVTLRICRHFTAPAEISSLRAIKCHSKKYFEISTEGPTPVGTLAKMLIACNCAVLNVTGNHELICPGITRIAKAYLIDLFDLMDKWGYIDRVSSDQVSMAESS